MATQRTALIVDDSVTIRKVIAIALADCGFTTTEAVDGEDGLEKAKVTKFNVIFTDINMPKLDGVAFIKGLRAWPGPNKHTPIVVATTESQAEKRAEGRAAGAKAWLVKPVRGEDVKDLVTKIVGP